MLREEDILLELEQFQKWRREFMAVKSKEERPRFPENKDSQERSSYGIFGTLLHMFIFMANEISRFFKIHKFVAFFSKLRISTDSFSFEPVSCGYNNAYTKLGLSLLSQNDINGAIRCLDASWRVHPCPHNASFGLNRALVSKLKNYPEASKVVSKYINIGKQFVDWPENWVYKIKKS